MNIEPELEEALVLLKESLDFILDCHAYHFGDCDRSEMLMEKLTLMIQHHKQRKLDGDEK